MFLLDFVKIPSASSSGFPTVISSSGSVEDSTDSSSTLEPSV